MYKIMEESKEFTLGKIKNGMREAFFRGYNDAEYIKEFEDKQQAIETFKKYYSIDTIKSTMYNLYINSYYLVEVDENDEIIKDEDDNYKYILTSEIIEENIKFFDEFGDAYDGLQYVNDNGDHYLLIY